MSHFSVMVIGENPEEQLAPFQENNMGDCPFEYLEFHDCTSEIDEMWEKNDYKFKSYAHNIDLIYSKSEDFFENEIFNIQKEKLRAECVFGQAKVGQIIRIKLEDKNEELYCKIIKSNDEDDFIKVKKIDPPVCERVQEVYSSKEELARYYFCYNWSESHQAFGYYHNPNAKWDWYELGGRWRGMLKLKDKNAYHELGDPGFFNNEPLYDADQAYKGDIDWEAMNGTEEEIEESKRFWDLFVEGDEPKNEKEKRMIEGVWHSKEYYLETYKTKERYAKVINAFHTYAVIKDGKWYEAGEMGWFGFSSATNEEMGNFQETFYDRFIKDLPDDTLISIYDCHI